MKYVMVDAVSMFRMRYVIEVPDDVGDMTMHEDTRSFPTTPIEWAKDTVTAGNTREFSQEHIDEVIVSCREVTLEEAIQQYREDNKYVSTWTDELIAKNGITEIGFKFDEYLKAEEERWRKADED
jgi:hypothetical protein